METKKITVIKNKTIGGDICKQRVTLHTQNGQDDIILINKILLAKDRETYETLCKLGFGKGRVYKNCVLMSQNFAIRANTLKSISKLIK